MSKLSSYYDKLPSEDRLLVSHIADLIELCEKKHIPRFSAFLDARQAALAENVMNHFKTANYIFYGGFDNALRTVLGIFPHYCEPERDEFPIEAIVFKYRSEHKITHRDFLGAIMSCGINRNMIGDIIVNDGYTVAFVYKTVAKAVISDISKVGSVGVTVISEKTPTVNIQSAFKEITGTVSSMRTDCVLSLATKLSREKSAQLIRSGNVTVNYTNIISVSTEIKTGDVFSARGYGKFILDEVSGKTKKDRIHIKIKKYI